MASWYTAISPPRSLAGEISAMYSGESIDAMPMPVPPTSRAATRCHGSRGMADPIAQSVNSTADKEQDLLAAEAVAQRAGNRRADQAADQSPN